MNVKVFALSLLNYIFLFSTLVNAIDLPADVIIIDGRRYVIKKPIRYTSRDQSKNFKKDPFYLDFMNRVMDSSEVLKGKSANPLSEIDRCISENINKKRSLQLSAIQCFSAEVDVEYKGYGIWSREDGNEELSMPKSPAAFLEGYLTGINLPQQTKENTKLPTCRDNPNHPDLNCVKFECDTNWHDKDELMYSYASSRGNWCGKSFCPEGKAFLLNSLRDLEYFFNINDPQMNLLLINNGLGVNRNSLAKIIGASFEEFDPKKSCLPCPSGSKMNDQHNQCLDANGCDAVLEEFSSVHKKCISKYQNYNLSCKKFYEGRIHVIRHMRDESVMLEEFILNYSGSNYYDSTSLLPGKKNQFINDFIVRSTQAIDRYELRVKSCKDGDEYIDDFANDFIGMTSKFFCDKNTKDQCKHSSCVECMEKFSLYNKKLEMLDMPNLRLSCGNSYVRRLLLNSGNIKYEDMDRMFNECGSQSFQCPDFSLTEQEVIDYAIRAGFECARRAAVMPSTKINRGQR